METGPHLPIAPHPPMGWNSYDCYNASVTEAEVLANAGFMARHMLEYGWEYVVIDYAWSHPSPLLTWNPDQDLRPGQVPTPLLEMDTYGRLLPAPNRFPSSSGGWGFAPLSAAIHALGLKFGIHLMRGIPRQAVALSCPVLGTYVTAEGIADQNNTCTWLNHMFGLDMTQPGAQAYLNSLFDLFAAWGVDFVKVDDLSNPYYPAELEGYRAAIVACGRPMLLSISPGETPLDKVHHVRQVANLWRISADFWDNWEQLKKQFRLCGAWAPYRAPDRWPDADMLPVGHLSLRGPWPEERTTHFTPAEQRTLLTLFCIARSPLMVGCDLPSSDAATLALLTNPEVLAANQSGEDNRPLYETAEEVIWTAQDSEGGGKYLALFNLRDQPARLNVTLKQAGLPPVCQGRDLWARQDLGPLTDDFCPLIPAHGTGFYKLR